MSKILRSQKKNLDHISTPRLPTSYWASSYFLPVGYSALIYFCLTKHPYEICLG